MPTTVRDHDGLRQANHERHARSQRRPHHVGRLGRTIPEVEDTEAVSWQEQRKRNPQRHRTGQHYGSAAPAFTLVSSVRPELTASTVPARAVAAAPQNAKKPTLAV